MISEMHLQQYSEISVVYFDIFLICITMRSKEDNYGLIVFPPAVYLQVCKKI